jgi:ACS family pantothenate transporter-like MFS transporter
MGKSKLREYFATNYQPGEQKLIQKIDFFILTFCCLSYFLNYVSLPWRAWSLDEIID